MSELHATPIQTNATGPGPGALAHYFARLRESLRDGGGAAALSQIAGSIRWRIDPACRTLASLNLENEAFDAAHGTDTRAEVPLDRLGLGVEQARHGNGLYRAISRSLFKDAMSRLYLDFEHYTFVDYGSGKGKALLLAAEFPFRRIVGVEYARALVDVAEANLRLHAGTAARLDRVETLCLDAREYEPPVEPLVCFFFNPFDASVWRGVLRRLARHHAEFRLPIHLVYVNFRDVDEIGEVFAGFRAFVTVERERRLRILSTIPERTRH
jgi:SAM-dependent methyltransferase